MYKEITTQKQMDAFLDVVGGLHDGLLKEIHLVNSAYVHDDLSMNMDFSYAVRVIFQRQFTNPSSIELIFCDVQSIQLDAPEEIFSAGGAVKLEPKTEFPIITLYFDCGEISSRKLYYRELQDGLGKIAKFGNHISSSEIKIKADITDGWAVCSNCNDAWKIINIKGLISCPKCNTSYEYE